MTASEFGKLIQDAANQRGGLVGVGYRDGKWTLYKPGSNDLVVVTFAEVIYRLEQWAKPPKPAFISVVLPTVSVEALHSTIKGHNQVTIYSQSTFSNAIEKALKDNGVIS